MRQTPALHVVCWSAAYVFLLSPILAQEPSEQRRVVKVNADRQLTPERHRLTVRQPDGTPTKSLRIQKIPAELASQGEFAMSAVLEQAPIAVEGGVIELDLSNTNNYYVLLSDSGIITLAAPRLLAIDEVQLLPFAELKVSVMRSGRPAANVPVEVQPEETSDSMHRLSALKVIGKTDANGIATFEQLPAGKAQVFLDRKVSQVQFGRSTGTNIAFSALQSTRLKPGQTAEAKFGENTRAVTGKFEFPSDVTEYDRVYFTVNLIYDNFDRQVSTQLHADGSFTCEDAPIGRAAVQVRGPILARERSREGMNFVDHYLVEIKSKNEVADSVQDLGAIRLVDGRRQPVIPVRSTATEKVARLSSGSGPVAWIALVDFEGLYSREIALLNDKAQLVRRPELGRVNGQIVCDTERQCVYAILSLTDPTKRQEALTCIDYRGDIRWQQKFVSTERTLDIALDTRQGSVWVLRSRGESGPPNLLVFDQTGQSIHKSTSTMTAMSYVAEESAFWLAGNTDLEKRDATTFQVLETNTLPHNMKHFKMSSAADGGLYLMERVIEGAPTDANRLFKFDGSGKLVGQIDFGNISVNAPLEGKDCLLTIGKRPHSDATASVLRIKHDFTEYEVIPTHYKFVTSLNAHDSYFTCLADYKLARMSLNGETITPDPQATDQQAEIAWAIGTNKK